jgi:cytochrome c biogenesis protein CcmG/thiol:disulfide interchange protein DsbE
VLEVLHQRRVLLLGDAASAGAYDKIGADRDGRVGFDWGVYGVPETYLIDREGNVAFKVVGPLSPEVLESQVLPLAAKLMK